jgi:arsenite methyltransferase
LIEAAGFDDVRNAKAQPIRLPDEILSQHFSAEEIAAFRASGVELKSVTVLATKPTMMKPMMAHERP